MSIIEDENGVLTRKLPRSEYANTYKIYKPTSPSPTKTVNSHATRNVHVVGDGPGSFTSIHKEAFTKFDKEAVEWATVSPVKSQFHDPIINTGKLHFRLKYSFQKDLPIKITLYLCPKALINHLKNL
jgi:hypothetical protein